MHGQCLVAVYPSRSEAELAARAAAGLDIPGDHIRISGADLGPGFGGEAPQAGMWDWLFGSNVPERDEAGYRAHFAEGRTAVSVLLDDGRSPATIAEVEQVLERYNPVDVHVEEGGAAGAQGPAGAAAAMGRAAEGQEEVIPLPREELKVGTRAEERVRHVRTYVVEEPIEQEVPLHDERVVIEKRPATTSAAGEPAEREYEIRERQEEPVVEKTTRADEELVVRKEPTERTARVRETVRRTKADVEGR